MTKSAKDLLEGAYALNTAEDNVAYYKDFAAVYDDGFAEDLGYQSPQLIAAYLAEVLTNPSEIADIGCGTGLIAPFLQGHQIDGFDISKEMIAVARAKDIYREFYEVDLTADLDGLPTRYDALISAGTFTHGHLGADILIHLLDLLRPKAWVTITVSVGHFEATDFQKVLTNAQKANRISQAEFREFKIFSKPNDAHSNDLGYLIRFQKMS